MNDEIVFDAHEKILEIVRYDGLHIGELADELGLDRNAVYLFFIKCHMTIYDKLTGAYEGMGS